jgi:hypothetical protein
MWAITVTASGVTGTMQTETITGQVPSKLVFTSAAQTVFPNSCSAFTIQIQDMNGSPIAVSTATPVALGASPTTFSPMTFFSDSACTNTISSANIPIGSSSVTVYGRAWTGAQYTLTGSTGALTPATQLFSVRPLVRRGACTIDSQTTNPGCPFPAGMLPQVNVPNTVLMTQVTSTSSDLSTTSVRCDLITTNSIHCARYKIGPPVTIYWQTLELPANIAVTRTTAYCPRDGGTSMTVPLAGGDLLLTSASTDSTDLGATTLYTVERSGNSVLINWEQPCTSSAATNYAIALQAVTLNGATLDPFKTSLPALQLNALVPGSSANTSTPAVMFTHQSGASGGSGSLCERALSAAAADGGVVLSRGLNASAVSNACGGSDMAAIVGGRLFVDGIGRVQSLSTTMLSGTSSATVPITPVDATRTLVFSSSQSGGAGQGEGESQCMLLAPLGDVIAAHVLDAGTALDAEELFLMRGSSMCDARWTSYVLELGP